MPFISDNALTMLANKLGIAIDTIHGILLAQAKAVLLSNLVYWLVWAASCFTLCRIWRYVCKISEGYNQWEAEQKTACTLVAVILVFIFLGILSNIPEVLTILFNPDAWVLQEAAKLIRAVK